ncbi:hypothetical protein L6164_013191 [Bauhinia variegata]|uniref:Uncharacterized protein n=1 Tax=Bauhinia variegata TaxID=167791 RepID=A0ACB9PF50_BAUVA|nr:hypothetical protein L6164_013191 [Bauhinia variegata]
MHIYTYKHQYTHLLLADDSLIFCKSSIEERLELKMILLDYEDVSGQKIDYEKSKINFSPNTTNQNRGCIKQGMKISVEAFNEKYLGLPTMVGRNKNNSFQSIKEKFGKGSSGGGRSCYPRQERKS